MQLPLFETKRPTGSRVTVTGSSADNEALDTEVPPMKMDQTVMVLCKATVTKVTHARMKNGDLERQHVLVIDASSIELGTSDDYTALGGLLWDRLQLRDGERFATNGDVVVEVADPQLSIESAIAELNPAPSADDDIVDAEVIDEDPSVFVADAAGEVTAS